MELDRFLVVLGFYLYSIVKSIYSYLIPNAIKEGACFSG
jgi:hypothetical protein